MNFRILVTTLMLAIGALGFVAKGHAARVPFFFNNWLRVIVSSLDRPRLCWPAETALLISLPSTELAWGESFLETSIHKL